MSVANLAIKGDPIFNLFEWSIFTNDDKMQERKFHIGERMQFISAHLVEEDKFKPYGWMVKFKCDDGFVGEAVDFNFVTEKNFNEIKSYFDNQTIISKGITNECC